MQVEANEQKIVINKRNEILFVQLNEILFIERYNQKTLIHTTDTEITLTISLKDLSSKLPDYFVRTHKSFIVNKHSLKELKMLNKSTYEAVYCNRKSALINKEALNLLTEVC